MKQKKNRIKSKASSLKTLIKWILPARITEVGVDWRDTIGIEKNKDIMNSFMPINMTDEMDKFLER